MPHVPFLTLNFDAELNQKLQKAFAEVNQSGWFVAGPKLDQFERQFADYCGSKYCLGISNGLDALFLGLATLKLTENDAVVVPAHTFIATWLSVTRVGAQIIPVDAEEATGQMDPLQLEQAFANHKNIKCVILVHLYGAMGQVKRIKEICKKNQAVFFEDAAQAHGSNVSGIKAGAWGDLAAFSFYPGKNLGALGDAGALVTTDETIYQKVRKLRNYGSSVKYHHDVVGYNHRLDELQAAFLSEKLNYLDRWNQQRAEQVQFYREALSQLSELQQVNSLADFTSWHLFVIRTHLRNELQQFLKQKEIETLIHYPIACHLSKAYTESGFKKGQFPIAEKFAETCLSIPIGPHLSIKQIQYVAQSIKEFFRK